MHQSDQPAWVEIFDQLRREEWFPAAALFSGSLLAGLGLARRGAVGATFTALGGALAFYGMAAARRRAPQGGAAQRLSRPQADPLDANLQDEADLRSWESFPASDPPGTY